MKINFRYERKCMCTLVEIVPYNAHAQPFLSRSQNVILSLRLKMVSRSSRSQVRFTPHVDDTIFASLHKRGAKRVLQWKWCYSMRKLAQELLRLAWDMLVKRFLWKRRKWIFGPNFFWPPAYSKVLVHTLSLNRESLPRSLMCVCIKRVHLVWVWH